MRALQVMSDGRDAGTEKPVRDATQTGFREDMQTIKPERIRRQAVNSSSLKKYRISNAAVSGASDP